MGKSVLTVRRWRRRYAAKGVDGVLKDATRPPGRKPLTARKIKQVVNLTLNEKPLDATHWSERTMSARAGIAPSSVHKIWAAHGLKPHLTKTFKLSRKSVDELKQAIMDYLDNHNGHPKPYVWTKTAAEIFSKVASAKQALESQH